MPHVVCYGQLRGDKSDDVRACYWKKKNLASQMTISVKFHYRNWNDQCYIEKRQISSF